MEMPSTNSPNHHKNRLYLDGNLQIIFGITLMAVLGVATITPAFPKIEKELHISEQDAGLLITAFTLPGAILTPVLGVLADRYGRKEVLVPSLFLFGVAGTAYFFLRDFHILLIFRLLQGVGGASLGSLNVTLIGDLFEGHERSKAMGYNASALSIGTASYPAIAGALATMGWYYPFLLPVLAIPIGLIVLRSMNVAKPENHQSLKEYLGKAVNSVKDRRIIAILIASVFTFIILYGSYLSFFPFLVDKAFSTSSFLIGLLFSVASLATAATSSQMGKLHSKFSGRTLLITAFIIYAVSLATIPLMPSLWFLTIPLVLFGIAQGLNIPSLQNMLANLAPAENRAAFMSLNGMVLRLGQTLGPVIMGGVFSLWGMHSVFYAGAGLALSMFILVAIMMNHSQK